MKTKLLEIIGENGCASDEADRIADQLIENGVTILPCRVGDPVYVVKYCGCHNTDPLRTGTCHQKATAKRPKIYGYVMLQKKSSGTICYKILQKEFNVEMLTKVGKTVFLSKREAVEATLKYSSNRSPRWIFLDEETAKELFGR